MKILVICHIEPMFEPFVPYDLPEKVMKYGNFFDKVLMVEAASELDYFHRKYWQLEKYYNDWCETWTWGFDREQLEDDGHKFVENYDYIIVKDGMQDGGWIFDWMRELPKDAEYYFVGGGREECLQTVKEIFDTLGYKNRVVESLTY